MSEVETAPDQAVIERDWRALAPGLAVLVGGAILIANAVIVTNTVASMLVTLFAALMVCGGFALIQPAPVLLILPHLAVAVLLFLQVTGLCRSSCGDFQSYQYIGVVPTSAVGAAWHLAMFAVGLCFLRGVWINAAVFRLLSGFTQGISLFFLVILMSYGHWCPSCAASHAFMAAQVVLVWRLTAYHHRPAWVLAIVIGALAMNAVFHHRYDTPAAGPSAELLGYLHAQRESGANIVVPVERTAAVETSAVVLPTTAASNAKANADDSKRLGLLAGNAKVRVKEFSFWGSADAPVTVRAHMNLMCMGCRGHWRDLETVRELINDRKARVQFIISWPISPEPNYGARLATYAAYSAGFLGEEELLAALDRFFADDGLLFMGELHETLTASMVNGQVPANVMTDALISTFKFMEPHVSAPRALEVYAKHRADIDGTIQANMNWLVKHGSLATPNYYFSKTDQSDRSSLNASSLDVEVWKAFIQRSSP